MANKRYKPILLTQASKILRAHSTQIDPPGLLEFKNAFLSRSDHAISLRSDLEPAYDGMFSYSNVIQGGDQEDYLSGAFYVDRAGHTIWFGRWCPFSWDGAFSQLFTIYDEGTISTDGVRSEVLGEGTEWLQKVWPGCLIRVGGEGADLYPIRLVTSDGRLVTSSPMPLVTAGEYEIFRVHPSNRADWPIKMESLGGFLIYNAVDLTQPVDENYISGPFYANIGRPNLGVWFGTDETPEEPLLTIAGISVGFDNTKAGLQLYQQGRYFCPIVICGADGAVFARNWFGDRPLRFISNRTYATQRTTYFLPTGTIQDCTAIVAGSSEVEVMTVGGDIYQIDADAEDVVANPSGAADDSEQFYYPDDAEVTHIKPFGDRAIYGKVGNYYVGANGLIGIINGTTYTSGVSTTLRGGCVAGSTAIVVGDADSTDGVILYFTDPSVAVNRATTTTSESFLSAAWSSFLDRIVAVGTGGECQTSDDSGATWTSRTVGPSTNINDVASDAQGRCFCCVCDSDGYDALAYLSLDGITWSQITPSNFEAEDLVTVRFNIFDGSFYISSRSGKVYRVRRQVRYETPGTTIGTFGYDSDYACDAKGFNFGGFWFVFVVGSKIWSASASLMTSWTERLAAPTSPLTSIAFDGNTTLVAVGIGGVIYRSTNSGVTWASVTSPTTKDLLGVTWHEVSGTGEFLAVGKEGTVLRSANGTGWTTMAFPTTTDCNTVCHDQVNPTLNQRNLYIGGNDGSIYVSRKSPATTYEPWAKGILPYKRYQGDDSANEPADHVMVGVNDRAPAQGGGVMSSIGLKYPNPFRYIYSGYAGPHAYQTGDVGGLIGLLWHPDWLDALEAYVNGNWFAWGADQTLNSLCAIGADDVYPIVVNRCFRQLVAGPGYSLGKVDGVFCSTDAGMSWSYETLPNTGRKGCQVVTQHTNKGVIVGNRQFAPIAADDASVYIFASSNFEPAPITIVELDTLEIAYEVMEIAT